jgi:hypothetical protein
MANPLHQPRYPKRSYLISHKQIDLSTRICSPDRLVDRPHNAPSFVFSTASSTPKRNDDDEASHGVSHAPQGELILLIFLRGDGTRHGRTRGTTGYRFLSFQSHFVCLVPISFRQFSSDFKFAFKSFCGCNTACWLVVRSSKTYLLRYGQVISGYTMQQWY